MTSKTKELSLLTTEDAPLSMLKSLKETYENAKPFPHIVLNSAEAPFPLDLEFLRTLRTSLQQNTPVTYKETDLFKLYQTKDLSDSKDPAIAALASTLYKDSFRSYVSELTSCPELTSRVDMAASAYASGCHLLCHDDVIGTRAVSFVLYLSDEDWDGKTDGGNLELYSSPHDPVPAKLNPPTFGTLVLFEVKPGVSFHAVQEVFRTKSPRLSVQGWFHASHPPKGVNSTSTLSDLTRRTNAQGFDSIPPKISPKVDDDSYLSRLSKYINQVYLQPDSVKKIREEFEENSTVHLYEFFNPSFVSVPKDDEESYETTGPVHMRRYRRLKKERQNAMLKLFQSDPDFVHFLEQCTGEILTGSRSEMRRFRRGIDYTVAHHGLLETKNRLDAVWTWCCDGTNKTPEAPSASGDQGGFECYLAADTSESAAEASAAEVYATDEAEENELLNVPLEHNALSLVLRDVGTMRFVKYVSRSSPCDRVDISTVYEIVEDDSNDSEEEEEKRSEEGDDQQRPPKRQRTEE